MDANYSTFSNMQEGEPLARFKKTIVGKVHVVALNPFTGQPEGIILAGEGEESYIEIWDIKSLTFFRKLNKKHFEAGRLSELSAPPVQSVSVNMISDEEIETLLNSHYLTLKHRVDKFTEPGPILRILNRARALGKSDKIFAFLEGRMAEVELSGLVK